MFFKRLKCGHFCRKDNVVQRGGCGLCCLPIPTWKPDSDSVSGFSQGNMHSQVIWTEIMYFREASKYYWKMETTKREHWRSRKLQLLRLGSKGKRLEALELEAASGWRGTQALPKRGLLSRGGRATCMVLLLGRRYNGPDFRSGGKT